MRKRNFRAQVWLNEAESQQLHDNAKRTGLSKESYLRSLINGYAPKELPSVDFYKIIRELRAIGNNINQLAVKANTTGYVDGASFEREAEHLRQAILGIQKAVTLPKKRSV